MPPPAPDLNPDNILITTDHVAKICDFGVSRILNSEEVRLESPRALVSLVSLCLDIFWHSLPKLSSRNSKKKQSYHIHHQKLLFVILFSFHCK